MEIFFQKKSLKFEEVYFGQATDLKNIKAW